MAASDQGEMERIQLRDAVKTLKADLELEETTHATEVTRGKECPRLIVVTHSSLELMIPYFLSYSWRS